MTELLPCPFCGGDAEVMRPSKLKPLVIVACSNPECDVIPTIEPDHEERAVASWNRRLAQPSITAASGVTMDDLLVAQANDDPVFSTWRDSVPDKHWVKLDLSALRVGYELGKRLAQPQRQGRAVAPVISFEDICALQDLRRHLDNLSNRRWPAKDWDVSDRYVNANIGHAAQAAAWSLPTLSRVIGLLQDAVYQSSRDEQPASASVAADSRILAYELDGVIADVELKDKGAPGFDEVCLNTIKRVRDALLTAALDRADGATQCKSCGGWNKPGMPDCCNSRTDVAPDRAKGGGS